MDGKMLTITAKTGEKSYDIIIGEKILPEVPLDEFRAESIALVVSATVYNLHKQYIDDFQKRIENQIDVPVHLMQMDDGEENKNYLYAQQFLEEFIKKGLTRKSLVVGIGGGVVGDFAGYLASLFMRGIPVIHIPTTLLAMVDSSLGGKVAVNLSLGKNIVGAFHQPKIVISDVRFLSTLPDNEMRNGLCEAIKHGMIGEKETIDIFKNNNFDSITQPVVITRLIEKSVFFKTSVVEQDETEGGIRAILNFGHTVGHGIESLFEYRGISHGEAVAIGIKAEVIISNRKGMLSDQEVDLVSELLQRYELVRKDISYNPGEVIGHMKYDKKNSGGKINFVLLDGIGNPVMNQHVDVKMLVEVLSALI